MQVFAYNRDAIKTLSAENVNPEFQNLVDFLMSSYVFYDMMLIVDNEGNVKATNSKDQNGKDVAFNSLIGTNISQESWFKIAKEKKQF